MLFTATEAQDWNNENRGWQGANWGCPGVTELELKIAQLIPRAAVEGECYRIVLFLRGYGTHYMKVTTYAPPFQPPFQVSEKCVKFRPLFYSKKIGKCISTQFFIKIWQNV